MKTIAIENLVKCDYKTGNTIDETILVEDKKNNFTFFVRPIPLDCGGTIDWTCIIGYDVYIFTGDENDRDYKKYLGRMQHISSRSLRRFMTKALKK